MRRIFDTIANVFGSIRWKLMLTYSVISLVPLFFITNSISAKTEDFFASTNQTDLKNFANRVAGQISREDYFADESTLPVWEQAVMALSKEMPARIIVVDCRAVALVDSTVGGGLVGKVFAAPEVIEALGKKTRTRVISADSAIVAGVPVLDDSSNVIGAVYVMSVMKAEQQRIAEIRVELLRLVSIISLVVIVLVFFVAQWLVNPLRKARSVILKMTEGHMNQRIEVAGRDEFAALGEAFNKMSERVEQIESARQEFVSNVSHELKTPLSAVKVLSESLLFQDGVKEEVYREFLHDINKEVDRMTDIVNELLVLVRLDQVEHPLNVAKVNINEMTGDIIKRLAPIAGRKDISITFDEEKQVTLDGDKVRLTLAVSNLVENAVKYSNEGGEVTVIVDSDHQNAFITVKDDGIGIAKDDQEKVFARFYRVDKARTRQTGGTGLGLAITHKTVLLHGGSIKLTSKEDEGSTFTIRVPLKRQEG